MADDLYIKIQERAYHLWEAEGCPIGLADEYWYRAETEILTQMAAKGHPVPAEDIPPPPPAADVPAPPPAAPTSQAEADPAPAKRTRSATAKKPAAAKATAATAVKKAPAKPKAPARSKAAAADGDAKPKTAPRRSRAKTPPAEG